jgi:hypothetical protein
VDDLSKVFKLMKQDGLNPNEIIYVRPLAVVAKQRAERAFVALSQDAS